MAERDIYVAIMRAAARGQGLRLTADECVALSLDDAIFTAAQNALTEAEIAKMSQESALGWATITPVRDKKLPHEPRGQTND